MADKYGGCAPHNRRFSPPDPSQPPIPTMKTRKWTLWGIVRARADKTGRCESSDGRIWRLRIIGWSDMAVVNRRMAGCGGCESAGDAGAVGVRGCGSPGRQSWRLRIKCRRANGGNGRLRTPGPTEPAVANRTEAPGLRERAVVNRTLTRRLRGRAVARARTDRTGRRKPGQAAGLTEPDAAKRSETRIAETGGDLSVAPFALGNALFAQFMLVLNSMLR